MATPRMREIFVKTAERVGCTDLEALKVLVDEAATQQRPMIDTIIDSKLVREEAYLKAISELLGIPWRED